MYFRVSWIDDRLTALFSDAEKQQRKKKRIEVPAHVKY